MIIGDSVIISNLNDLYTAYGGILVDFSTTPEDTICSCTDLTTGTVAYAGLKGSWLFPVYSEGKYIIEISTKDPAILYKKSVEVEISEAKEVKKVEMAFETYIISTKIQKLDDLNAIITKKSGNSGSIVQEGNQFKFNATNSLWQFNDLIDLTGKTKIIFHGFKQSSTNSDGKFGLSLAQTTTTANGVNILSKEITFPIKDYELDVSDINGKYYLGIVTGNGPIYCKKLSII